jgi:hypothetical protein
LGEFAAQAIRLFAQLFDVVGRCRRLLIDARLAGIGRALISH